MSPHVSETPLTNTKFNENLLSDFSDGCGETQRSFIYSDSEGFENDNTTVGQTTTLPRIHFVLHQRNTQIPKNMRHY
jgi:hypothetical protein